MFRNTRCVLRICFRCFILSTVFAFFNAPGVAAQDETLVESGGSTFEVSGFERSLDEATRSSLAAARSQLEQALADSDSNTRFDALRGAIALREPWIAEIVLPLDNSPDITERNFALEAIAASNPEVGREVFLNALRSTRRSIRLRGLLGLERLADPGTVVDVIKVLESDEDPDLKVVAARTLGAIGDIGGSTALRAAIQSPYQPLRRQSVLALLAIGKEDVGRYLIRLMDDDNQTGTVEILKLVALVPDPSLIELLSPYLNHETQRVRIQASVTVLSILEGSRTGAP
jgi:HEAT repeat protein